jgi:DNA replication protein DnaC
MSAQGMKLSSEEASKSLRGASNNELALVTQKTLANPEIKKVMAALNLNDDDVASHLPLFLSYLEDLSYCNKCPGLDKCAKEIPLTISTLYLDDNKELIRGFGPCELYHNKEKLLSAFSFRDYQDNWLSLTPNKVTPKSERATSVFAYLGNTLKDKEHPWAYLQGEEGSGKSYLLVAFINAMALQGAKVNYLDCSKRFDELKSLSITNKNLFNKTINELQGCDILVLDNFGGGYRSDYIRDQVLIPLLAERSRHHLFTYFASIYSLEEIVSLFAINHYGEVPAKGLGDIIKKNIDKVLIVKNGFEQYL